MGAIPVHRRRTKLAAAYANPRQQPWDPLLDAHFRVGYPQRVSGDATAHTRRVTLPRRLGRYELVEEVASGGMATVYVGRMHGRGGFVRTVAIKLLHEHLVKAPESVAMFFDEARLSARILHPNVVRIYDVDAIEGKLIIVMDLIEGLSLRQLRKAAGQLPLPLLARIMSDALAGLDAAHRLRGHGGEEVGLVHRDVTPQNILVGTDGVSRIADFGVAKASGRLMTTGHDNVIKGNLRYLSPEQITGEPMDRRTDIFAAGIVLWECLACRPLFSASTDTEVLSRVLSGDIKPPSHHRTSLPLAWDEVCLTALERDPDKRFASARELATAIRAAVDGELAQPEEVAEFLIRHSPSTVARVRSAAESLPSLEDVGDMTPERLHQHLLAPADRSSQIPSLSGSALVTPSPSTQALPLVEQKTPPPAYLYFIAGVAVMAGALGAWTYAFGSGETAAGPSHSQASATGEAPSSRVAGSAAPVRTKDSATPSSSTSSVPTTSTHASGAASAQPPRTPPPNASRPPKPHVPLTSPTSVPKTL